MLATVYHMCLMTRSFSARFLGVVHAVNAEEAQPLLDNLAEALEPQVTVLGEIGPGLGVHVGPGTIGVCWLRLPA